MNEKEALANDLRVTGRTQKKQFPLIYEEIPFKHGRDKLIWICFRIRWTIEQIADAFGVTERTAKRWKNKYKVSP